MTHVTLHPSSPFTHIQTMDEWMMTHVTLYPSSPFTHTQTMDEWVLTLHRSSPFTHTKTMDEWMTHFTLHPSSRFTHIQTMDEWMITHFILHPSSPFTHIQTMDEWMITYFILHPSSPFTHIQTMDEWMITHFILHPSSPFTHTQTMDEWMTHFTLHHSSTFTHTQTLSLYQWRMAHTFSKTNFLWNIEFYGMKIQSIIKLSKPFLLLHSSGLLPCRVKRHYFLVLYSGWLWVMLKCDKTKMVLLPLITIGYLCRTQQLTFYNRAIYATSWLADCAGSRTRRPAMCKFV